MITISISTLIYLGIAVVAADIVGAFALYSLAKGERENRNFRRTFHSAGAEYEE